jgi:hypothetical protein
MRAVVRVGEKAKYIFLNLKLPPYSMAGFDLIYQPLVATEKSFYFRP